MMIARTRLGLGPLRDLAQLEATIARLRGIPGVGAVTIDAFDDRRALLSLQLLRPVDLPGELRTVLGPALGSCEITRDRVELHLADGPVCALDGVGPVGPRGRGAASRRHADAEWRRADWADVTASPWAPAAAPDPEIPDAVVVDDDAAGRASRALPASTTVLPTPAVGPGPAIAPPAGDDAAAAPRAAASLVLPAATARPRAALPPAPLAGADVRSARDGDAVAGGRSDAIDRAADLDAALLALAFDDAPIGKALADPSGRWLRVNRRLAELVGRDRDELLRRGTQDVVLLEDAEDARRLGDEALAGLRDRFAVRQRCRHADGHLVELRLEAALVRTPEGRPRLFVLEFVDARGAVDDAPRLDGRVAVV